MSVGDGKQQEARAAQIITRLLHQHGCEYGSCADCVNAREWLAARQASQPSRSVQRREALQKGEPMPTFEQPSHASGEPGQDRPLSSEALCRLADDIEMEHDAFQRGVLAGERAMAEKAAQALNSIAYSNEESARTVWQRCFDAVRSLAGAEPQEKKK